MNRRTAGTIALFIFGGTMQVSAVAQTAPILIPQSTQAVQPNPALSAAQVESLVAPIALYPDALLSQVLVASTYPLEIVAAAQWLDRNPALSGPALQEAARQQNWDPSVQALVAFPDVLRRLSENIQWTTDLGNAFLQQQAGVMDAVQRMRTQAINSGKLTSNGLDVVTTQPQGGATIVEIQPADPQVIYVPAYDPFTIWGPPAFYPYPVLYYSRAPIVLSTRYISYCSPIFVGSLFSGWSGWGGWGWRPNWSGRTVFVNNDFFYRYGYGSRVAVAGVNRLNGTAVWFHDSSRRSSVRYSNRDVANRFPNDSRRTEANRAPAVIQRTAPAAAPAVSRPPAQALGSPAVSPAPARNPSRSEASGGFRSERRNAVPAAPNNFIQDGSRPQVNDGFRSDRRDNLRNAPSNAIQGPRSSGVAPRFSNQPVQNSNGPSRIAPQPAPERFRNDAPRNSSSSTRPVVNGNQGGQGHQGGQGNQSRQGNQGGGQGGRRR